MYTVPWYNAIYLFSAQFMIIYFPFTHIYGIKI